VRPIRLTLERLRRSARFTEWVAGERAAGKKDWWILLRLVNAVLNFRLRNAGLQQEKSDAELLKREMKRLMNNDEQEDEVPFPEETLYSDYPAIAEGSIVATTAMTWGLVVRSRTPALVALTKLMTARYGHERDDVEHEDFFAPL
jgi:hypothetical protein